MTISMMAPLIGIRIMTLTTAKGTWIGVLFRDGFPGEELLTWLIKGRELVWEQRRGFRMYKSLEGEEKEKMPFRELQAV